MATEYVHFQCPECHPTLNIGVTPAICGDTIRYLTGDGRAPKCPACRQQLRDHKRSHSGRNPART